MGAWYILQVMGQSYSITAKYSVAKMITSLPLCQCYLCYVCTTISLFSWVCYVATPCVVGNTVVWLAMSQP